SRLRSLSVAEKSGAIVVCQRGMALLLVVAMISVLSAVVIRFNRTTSASMEQVSAYKSDTVLSAMAESGIEIGLILLDSDRLQNDFDALSEPWALLEDQNLSPLFDQGELRVTIEDYSGRLPINRLVADSQEDDPDDKPGTAAAFRRVLLRLLTSGEFAVAGDAQATEIVDSLTDWLDPDDTAQVNGAESAYYLSLPSPYIARNGAVEFMEELLLVKGVTPEILYGNDEKKGLSEYIRLYGRGRININTAPRLLLQSLAEGVPAEAAETADAYRRDASAAAALMDPNWYRSLLGWPEDAVIEDGLVASSSAWFRIRASARQQTGRMQMWADLNRTGDGLVVMHRGTR
ncbi:MAG: general secretion pathway protein GspK, partial [Desulfocapsaceae bacterium]